MSVAASRDGPLSAEELKNISAYWRAANYLSVGQIYLLDNPLLREPLELEAHQAAPARSLGHDARAQLHLRAPQPRDQRARPQRDLRLPGRVTAGRAGGQHLPRGHLQRGLPGDRRATQSACNALFRQFSFPGGIPSHAAPETPGSIHEGGELGYSLSHAYGAVLGQSRISSSPASSATARPRPARSRPPGTRTSSSTRSPTAPCCRSSISTATRSPIPTVLARITHEGSGGLFVGYGYAPRFREGTIRKSMHQQMAAVLGAAITIRALQRPRVPGDISRPRWR